MSSDVSFFQRHCMATRPEVEFDMAEQTLKTNSCVHEIPKSTGKPSGKQRCGKKWHRRVAVRLSKEQTHVATLRTVRQTIPNLANTCKVRRVRTRR